MPAPKLKFADGTQCNFRGKSAEGKFTLHGDPSVKIEKIHTIVEFPGGSIEISRTTDGDYWAHIAVVPGKAVDARIDADSHYLTRDMIEEIAKPDFRHIAVRVRP